MIDYPQKGSHYAHKTFRLMHKAMVAADYGRDVFCLLSIILHTEDAARYRGPVSYYNTQLMETLGFKKWEQFDAVRAKAIDSGWLQYEGCGKRTPGKYFVTIPEGFEQVDDGLMEECISPENGYKRGYDEGYRLGYDAGVKQGIDWGIDWGQTGGQTGGTSYPIPSPSPEPNPSPINTPPNPQEPAKPKKSADAVGFDDIGFLDSHNTPDMRSAWDDWVRFRKRKRKPISGDGGKETAAMLCKLPIRESIAAIRRTISKDWQGLQPCPRNELHLYLPKNPDEIDF